MVFIPTEIVEVLDPMVAPKRYSQAQPLLGIMNETTNKDSSIFSWFWHWAWIMGFNPYGLTNSQLIKEVHFNLSPISTGITM